MATILGRKIWNVCQGIEVDLDPGAATGTPAPMGSIALAEDGSGLYVKTGVGDTAWTLLGGGGGGGTQTTFVLRPGGVAGANVYTDWATLIAAHALVEGPTIIEYDDRFGAPVITAGGPYDLRDTICRGRMLSGTPVIVTVTDGATFTNLERMEWMRFDYSSATPAMVAPAGLSYFRMWGSSIQNTGAAPFFDVTTPGAIFLTQFENAGGYNPLPGGTPVVDLGATGITSFSLDEACSNGTDTLAGTPGSTVTVAVRDTSGRYIPIAGPFTGAVVGPTLVGIAANLEYDDTLAAPLLGATQTQAAIDALKAFTATMADADGDTTISVDNNPGADSDTITMFVGDQGNSDYDVSGAVFTASISGIALEPPSEIAGGSPTPTFTITGAGGYYTAGDLELIGGTGDISYGTTGGTAYLRGGTGGDGGNAFVEGGVAGDASGTGGAVIIRASASGASSTDASTVTIQGSQAGLGINQAGGSVNIYPGQAQGGAGGTEDCGDIELLGAENVGTGTAGSIRLQHGLAPLGTDGAIWIERVVGGVGDTGEMRWVENDVAENYMAIKAAQGITSNFILVWPDAQGGINQPMVNDGSGNLSFGPAGFIVTAVQIALYLTTFGELVRCDPTAGGFTVTLPAITAASAGTEILVKNTSASTNTITISPTGDTIDGAVSATITTARGFVRLVSDGVGDWMVV